MGYIVSCILEEKYMLTLYVRVYSDYYTLAREIEHHHVSSMSAIHELAHQYRNNFFADRFVIENGVLRRYRKDEV